MSHMSSRFLPKTATEPQGELVPLMVHPEDRDRLQALSGIWPVADTLTRMIDVFIATGSAQSAAAVRTVPAPPAEAQPSPAEPPAPVPQEELAKISDVGRTEAEIARPDAPAPTLEKPARTKTRRPAPSGRVTTRRARPATKPDPAPATQGALPLLAFTREDYPNLTFTRLTGYTIGEVTRQEDGLNWTSLFEEAVALAIAAGHGPAAMDRIGVRLREGKHEGKGFRWCEKLNLSLQISTSNYMFTRVLRIADLIGVPVRVGVSWTDTPAAAHPGQNALVSAKPMRRPAKAPRLTKPSDPKGAKGSDARFPTVGSMVSYVYLDRPDDEKVSHIVDGPADAEAGQVSRTSPLGLALLETPSGSVTAIDVNGTKRQVRVLEVVGD